MQLPEQGLEAQEVESRADAMLAEMTLQGRMARAEGREKSPDALSILDRPTNNVSAKPPKMRYSHEAMIDLMLARPGIAQNELAQHFGYSPGWISTVVNSDAFKALYAQRRADLADPELIMTIKERLDGVAAASLRVLAEKLAQPALSVPDELVLRAAEMSTKALGFGAKAATSVQVNVTSEARISNLAHRLIALQKGTGGDVVDV